MLISPKETLKNFRVASFLAYKSVVRGNRGMLVMVILMMALVFNNLIFITSLMNGLSATAHAQIINFLTGHIVIEPEDEERFIYNADELQEKINSMYGVSSSTLRTDFGGTLKFNGRQTNFQITAVDPSTETSVTRIQDNLIAGQVLDKDDTDSIVMGVQTAGLTGVELESYSLKGVKVGDKVKLEYFNGVEREYTVKGIFDTNFVQSDMRTYISEKEFHSIFPELRNNASQILVTVSNPEDLSSMIQFMRDEGIKENIRTWEDTAGVIKSVTESFDGINVLISAIALFVAGITIFIVIYVDILNRRKDIGIQRAIGIKETAIGISYVMRSLFYTFCGILIGYFVFDYIIVPYFQNNPLPLPLGAVSLVISKDYLFLRAISLFIAAFLGAYIPIRTALRIKIIDAIWGE